jgi:hypothetical protein
MKNKKKKSKVSRKALTYKQSVKEFGQDWMDWVDKNEPKDNGKKINLFKSTKKKKASARKTYSGKKGRQV